MVARSNGRGKLQPACADGLVKFTPVDVRRDEWRCMILGHIDADCLQQLSDGELECCAHIVSAGVYSVSLQVDSKEFTEHQPASRNEVSGDVTLFDLVRVFVFGALTGLSLSLLVYYLFGG